MRTISQIAKLLFICSAGTSFPSPCSFHFKLIRRLHNRAHNHCSSLVPSLSISTQILSRDVSPRQITHSSIGSRLRRSLVSSAMRRSYLATSRSPASARSSAESTAAESPAGKTRKSEPDYAHERHRGSFIPRNHALGPGVAASLVVPFRQHPLQHPWSSPIDGRGTPGEPAPTPDAASPFR